MFENIIYDIFEIKLEMDKYDILIFKKVNMIFKN